MATKKQVDVVVTVFYQGWIVDEPLEPGQALTLDADVVEYLLAKEPPVVKVVETPKAAKEE